MMELKALRYFVVTADTLNFTKAATQLEIPKSALSKAISKLEHNLGIKLFERSSRVVLLTEAGEILYARAQSLLDEAKHIVADMQTLQPTVNGQLRIAAPPTLGRYISTEIIPAFLAKWPEVSVTLKLSYDYEDLFKQGLDLAFRMGKNRDQSLIEKPLGLANRVVVAAPSYIKNAGAINKPEDLTGHRCAQIFSTTVVHWQLKKDQQVYNLPMPTTFQCSDMEALKNAVIGGVGVAQMPWLSVRGDIQSGKLCHVLPHWINDDLPISVVYRIGLNKPPKLAAFLALVEEKKQIFDLKSPA
ncbi:MAG: LysR family transcriptional regulator [Thalassotalea sp.]